MTLTDLGMPFMQSYTKYFSGSTPTTATSGSSTVGAIVVPGLTMLTTGPRGIGVVTIGTGTVAVVGVADGTVVVGTVVVGTVAIGTVVVALTAGTIVTTGPVSARGSVPDTSSAMQSTPDKYKRI